MKISKNDTRGAATNGERAELEFELLANSIPDVAKVKLTGSKSNDNRVRGIDARLIWNNRETTVDVKAIRKERGERFTKKVCFEIRNINGNPGSIFKEAEYLAIEWEDYFILVKTHDIIELIKRKVNFKSKTIYTIKSNNCLQTNHRDVWDNRKGYVKYVPLTRSQFKRDWDGKPNEDVIVYLSASDIAEIEYTKWMKIKTE